MTSRWGVVFLIVAAVVVAVENYLFFTGGPDADRGAESDEVADERTRADTEETGAPQPVNATQVAAWISLQPDDPRSPFLTRAEALVLGDEVRSLDLRLRGVLWGPTRRVAWIDGRPRSENDWVGEHRVERIEPEAVWLRRGDELVELAIERDGTVVEQGSREGVE
jgi:hypothetical protein